MLNQISLGLQLVHRSRLCWGQTVLQKHCGITAGKVPAQWEWLPWSKGNDFKEKQSYCCISTKNRVEIFLHFIFMGFGRQGDVVLNVEMREVWIFRLFQVFFYLLGGPRRSWLGCGSDHRGSWSGLRGGSLNLLLRNRFRGQTERWTERERCCRI